ncbi:MAG: citrate/2-methylcitrate synthase [Treponema sp.]|jgi:citrate synthase|nr:citrate/2-methylcitrate synthase [Treponema sp.]
MVITEKQEKKLVCEYARKALKSAVIDNDLYAKYEVKRGLRDKSGKGVLAGLTEISEIVSYIIEDNDLVPCEGKLYYRGINIESLVKGFTGENRFGYEEIVFLLLFGHLPKKKEFLRFRGLLSRYAALPEEFVRDTIMNAPSQDMMNSLAKSVLTLYYYDNNAEDISIANIIRQSIQLIAQFPLLAVYGYQSYTHYHNNRSLVIHPAQPELSAAENILYMLRPDSSYTDFEAKVLDLALVLHAEHGGGNNSTFTMHVVTSSGTDTYSSVVASLASLKGPKHGGANIKVVQMFQDMKEKLKDWDDDDEIAAYVARILKKEAFDKSGLVYGMGHAVYSLSDPRALIFKGFVEQLAEEKGRLDEYRLYSKVESIAPRVIGTMRKIYKGVSANVDFYSGFVYSMLDLPGELFTPLFAVARISGWCAHRLEEIANAGKIIRPSYKSVTGHIGYIPMDKR